MGRVEEVASLSLRGNTPGQIASSLDIQLSTTLDYLERAVGKGLLRRADLYFSLPPGARVSPATREDHEVIRRFGGGAHMMGELYEDLRSIEIQLHDRICVALQEEYGVDERGWWVRGIPEAVRDKCARRRERDPDRLDLFAYTDLIDLKDIFERR